MLTRKLGDRLAAEGYRGFLEVDYLVDVDTGELYLGELNPRISGVTSMTNVTAGAYADIPLFLFHLLEYLDVDYEIDVDDINRRWAQAVERRRLEPARAQGHARRRRAADRGAADRHLADRRRRARSRSPAGATTGTACTTRPRRSSCACWRRATTPIPAPTWACSWRARAMQDDDGRLTERARQWIAGIHVAVRRRRRCRRRSRRRTPARWRSRPPRRRLAADELDDRRARPARGRARGARRARAAG